MMRGFVALLSALIFSGCVSSTSSPPPAAVQPVESGPVVSRAQASTNFRRAVARVEPVAERICKDRTDGIQCDFLIQIDPDASAPVNAFQTVNDAGRPLIIFTQALIADARNADEIAFVIGHEAAHHIAQHLPQLQQNASIGAVLGGLIAGAAGADGALAQDIVRAGAFVGSRTYSKEHELEADSLGTVITHEAGFDPVRGAAFFNRIPDPGNQFLGSHPPNAQRIATVQQVASQL